MTTPGALAGLNTFDALNYEYELAYKDNAFKKTCITQAIARISPGSRILDVGCGTGVPVSDMLSAAGLDVTGFDISPKMVKLAQDRIRGSFSVSDMLSYDVKGQTYAAVFMIFAHLQLSYRDFHAAAFKYASALAPGGVFVLGQMPSDGYVKDEGELIDDTYVEDYPAPFMGEMLPTFMISRAGQRAFLQSMGLEIVWESIDLFQPQNEKCVPEEQQYLIARRGEADITPAKPLPKA